MCVCLFVCTRVYVNTCVHVCKFMSMMCVRAHVCMFINANVCMSVRVNECMCACVYGSMCVVWRCICVYMDL